MRAHPVTAPVLHGYRWSVATRIVRIVLVEKGIAHEVRWTDPFAEPKPRALLALNPMGRVPVLEHDGLVLTQSAAITAHLDRAFPKPCLTPADPAEAARADEVVAAVMAEGFVPMVRQVYAHRVFRPAEGARVDPDVVAAGMMAARPVLDFLDRVALEGAVVRGPAFTRADAHLAPVIAGFAAAPEGAAALARRPDLLAWWTRTRRRPSVEATDEGRPGAS